MTIRRVLVLRHVPWEGPGLIADALAVRGIEMDISDLGTDRPPLGDYDGLVVLGGPMRATDAILDPERAMLRAALVDGMPTLGICLGHQLLSLALGGALQPGASREIGLSPITLTADSPLGRVGEAKEVLHWHGDSVTLPPGAQLLARTAQCANQAFRMAAVTGLQFHLEVGPPVLREWMLVPEVVAEYGGEGADLEVRLDECASDLARLAAGMFGEFATRVADD